MIIYVEIRIRSAMDELWRLTQSPELHARWDLRFSSIKYFPRAAESDPQRFRYVTRIGFGMEFEGHGETVGERVGAYGERASALKFWSEDSKSLIREGAGYWRYVPTSDGLRFLTAYDYRVRFGVLGRVLDTLVFRPLLGWATAWSFDRLRLWIEKSIDPAISLRLSLIHMIARLVLAFVWLYQGAIPKILDQHSDELAMIHQGGVSPEYAPLVAQVFGWCEVIFAISMLIFIHQRWHFLLTMFLMAVAIVIAAVLAPRLLEAAFNPVSLNASIFGLAWVGWMASRDLPSARHCLRRPAEGGA